MEILSSASRPFDSSELTALAHLYRGENYQATAWRCRLDATTNWAVVTTGLAFSATFNSAASPPWPLLMLAALLTLFLAIEARRYRYFDLWRTRVRVLERCLFVPLLRRAAAPAGWSDTLAADYERLDFHLSVWAALGRRLRRNYAWLFALHAFGLAGKLTLHPKLAESAAEVVARAEFGAIPGAWVLAAMTLFYGTLLAVALGTLRGSHALRQDDAMLALAGAGPHRPAHSPP